MKTNTGLLIIRLLPWEFCQGGVWRLRDLSPCSWLQITIVRRMPFIIQLWVELTIYLHKTIKNCKTSLTELQFLSNICEESALSNPGIMGRTKWTLIIQIISRNTSSVWTIAVELNKRRDKEFAFVYFEWRVSMFLSHVKEEFCTQTGSYPFAIALQARSNYVKSSTMIQWTNFIKSILCNLLESPRKQTINLVNLLPFAIKPATSKCPFFCNFIHSL